MQKGRFEIVIAAASQLAADAAGIVVFAMMLVSVFDVALRYLFNSPLASSYELVQFCMLLIVFGGLGWTGYIGGHVALNLLGFVLDRSAWKWVKAAVPAIGATLFALIAVRSGYLTWQYYLSGEASNTLRFPFYPFAAVVTMGAMLYAASLFLESAKALVARQAKSPV
jgi:TRAP-type transport system small permease protein